MFGNANRNTQSLVENKQHYAPVPILKGSYLFSRPSMHGLCVSAVSVSKTRAKFANVDAGCHFYCYPSNSFNYARITESEGDSFSQPHSRLAKRTASNKTILLAYSFSIISFSSFYSLSRHSTVSIIMGIAANTRMALSCSDPSQNMLNASCRKKQYSALNRLSCGVWPTAEAWVRNVLFRLTGIHNKC